MSVFWNPTEGRLRALWRITFQALLMAVFMLAPIILIAEPLTALHRRGLFLPDYGHESYDRIINMIVGPFLVAGVLISIAIAGRWLDHRTFADFGARIDRAWWYGLLGGFLLGTVLMTLVFVVEYASGWLAVTGFCVPNVSGVSLALAFSFSFVKVLCVATYEEFLSRGYHLRNMTEGANLRTAVFASSAFFTILHATNENASAMSTAGLFVNSLLFTAALLATGRLSTPIGLHIAWNLCEGALFGFPVSGDKEGASVIAIKQLGPTFVTGGVFGPEAGLIGIAASLFGVGVIVGWAKVTTRKKQ